MSQTRGHGGAHWLGVALSDEERQTLAEVGHQQQTGKLELKDLGFRNTNPRTGTGCTPRLKKK